ncbi:MAG: ribonuclease HI family protein [Patescibacteria group bacterium]
MKRIVIYTDGGSRGNPGPSGAGAVVYEGEKEIGTVSKFLGIQTNNFAEYEALILALKCAHRAVKNLDEHEVLIRMDSELIVKQMKGEYRVKAPVLKEKYMEIKAYIARHALRVHFEHVRREYNTRADELANHAMDKGD